MELYDLRHLPSKSWVFFWFCQPSAEQEVLGTASEFALDYLPEASINCWGYLWITAGGV